MNRTIADFPGMARVCFRDGYSDDPEAPYKAAQDPKRQCLCETSPDAAKRRWGEAIAALRIARRETARAAQLLRGQDA